jgi:type IV fimbrial biogenesis protein FimT
LSSKLLIPNNEAMMVYQQKNNGILLRCEKQQGFTLLELLVTVAVVAILAGVAIPAFRESELRAKLSLLGSDMLTSANLARSEAIKRRTTVRLCASSDGLTCSGTDWSQGWVVTAGDPIPIQKRAAAPEGYAILTDVVVIEFRATGLGATTATLKICKATPYAGSQERVISIDGTGRATSTKTTTASCS